MGLTAVASSNHLSPLKGGGELRETKEDGECTLFLHNDPERYAHPALRMPKVTSGQSTVKCKQTSRTAPVAHDRPYSLKTLLFNLLQPHLPEEM